MHRGEMEVDVVPTHSQAGTRRRWVFRTMFQPLYLPRDSVGIVQEAGWASRSLWTTRKILGPH
jgi:hypothetical protein